MGDRFPIVGKETRDRGSRKGEEGKGWKTRIEMYYIQAVSPHKACDHSVLQTCTNGKTKIETKLNAGWVFK